MLFQRVAGGRGFLVERLRLLDGNPGRYGVAWIDSLSASRWSTASNRVHLRRRGNRSRHLRCGCLELGDLPFQLSNAPGCNLGGAVRFTALGLQRSVRCLEFLDLRPQFALARRRHPGRGDRCDRSSINTPSLGRELRRGLGRRSANGLSLRERRLSGRGFGGPGLGDPSCSRRRCWCRLRRRLCGPRHSQLLSS